MESLESARTFEATKLISCALGLLICGMCSSSSVWPVVFSGLHRTVLSVVCGLVLNPKYWFPRAPEPTDRPHDRVISAPCPPESSKRLETSFRSWLLGVPRLLHRFQLASKANPSQLASDPSKMVPKSPRNHPQTTKTPSSGHPNPHRGRLQSGVPLKIMFPGMILRICLRILS